MSDALRDEYTALHGKILAPVAKQLEVLIASHLAGTPHIDRISARAKSPDRFMAKAAKIDKAGSPKYTNPLVQIQDQIGARVVVFYRRDVEPTSKVLMKYFRHIEEKEIVPESEWAFGYFGKHYVLALPKEAVPSEIPLTAAPHLFELQISTLFQHAWSEAEHDLGYKPREALSLDQNRRLAFTAAQAWGADRIFDELYEELAPKA